MHLLVGFIRAVSAANRVIGMVFAWLALGIVLVCFAVVVQRYALHMTQLWAQDLYVWLSGAMFTAVAGFAMLRDDHVRVDILYRAWGIRGRAIADLVGVVVFLLPFIIVILIYAWPYVLRSWRLFEGSQNVGGMPGLFVLKTFVPVFCIVVGLQGLAWVARSILVIAGREECCPSTSATSVIPRRTCRCEHRSHRRNSLGAHVLRRDRHAAAGLSGRLQPGRHRPDLRPHRLAVRRLRSQQLRLGHHPLSRHDDQRGARLGAALHLHGRDARADRHRRAPAHHDGQALRQSPRRPRLFGDHRRRHARGLDRRRRRHGRHHGAHLAPGDAALGLRSESRCRRHLRLGNAWLRSFRRRPY